jgi:Flp pilus assembly protein TadD
MLRFGMTVAVVAGAVLAFSLPAFSQESAAADKQVCDGPADLALGLEDYPAAIRLHLHLLRSHPGDALAHYHLGFAYGMVGRGAEEIAEYRKSVSLGLHSWDLFLNLGMAFDERRDLPSAASAFAHAVLLAPQRAEPHFNLALVLEAENRLGEALKEIAIARQLEPEDPDIENTRAILCAETGDIVCARDGWTHLVQMGYAPAQANLAIVSPFRPSGTNQQH